MIGDLAALAAGVLAGAAYFGGLWWTVRRIAGVRRPALLLVGSYMGRLAFLGAVLYGVLRTGIVHLLLAVVGILLGRWLLVRRLGGANPEVSLDEPAVDRPEGGGSWS